MRIVHIMTRDVCYCSPDETLDSAAYLMWDNDCGSLPVCDGLRRVIGMITDRDICMAALFHGRTLRDLRVADAMSRNVRSCRPSDRTAEVERVMRERQIRRLPVTTRGGELVGIVSLADLAREVDEDTALSSVTSHDVSATLAAICEPDRHRHSSSWRQTG